MSTIPSTPGAGPSRPSRPRPRPVVAIPTQPCAEEEDPEIAALTKKISALREKRAREEEERRRREVAEKVRREELEWARAVEARRRAAEIAKEQGVGRKRSLSPEMEGDRAECARCRRMGLACVWPSGGRGTACNACAGAKQRCRGGEVERPERPEKKKARATQTKWSAESEEERVAMWVSEVPQGAEELNNVVQATHNLVMRGVLELEEWRKEARAERRAVAAERKLLRKLLRGLGEKLTAGKEVAEVAEKKAEAEVGAEKDAEVEMVEIVEERAEVEKEEGEVVAESGPKKPEDILQASPGTPPSA